MGIGGSLLTLLFVVVAAVVVVTVLTLVAVEELGGKEIVLFLKEAGKGKVNGDDIWKNQEQNTNKTKKYRFDD